MCKGPEAGPCLVCEQSELEQSEREGGSWSCRALWAKGGLWVEEGRGTGPDSGAHRRCYREDGL